MPKPWIIGVALLIATLPATAADWQATRLLGAVEQLVDDQWIPLKRGDTVPDGRLVRTLADGRIELARDTDVLSLSPGTQVMINDRTAEPYTTVTQSYGTVEADVTVQPFEHFEVRTPLLAAVVKGTHFVVHSTSAVASVRVTRGAVAVEALETGKTTLVKVDETASVRQGGDLQVAARTAAIPATSAASESGVPVSDDPTARLSAGVENFESSPASANRPATSAQDTSGDVGSLGLVPAALPDAATGSGVADLLMSYEPPARLLSKPDKDAESMFGPLLGGAILLAGIVFGGIGIVLRRIFG